MKITKFLAGDKVSGYKNSDEPVVQESKNGDNYVIVITDSHIEDNTFFQSTAKALFAEVALLELLKVGMTIA